MKEKLVVGKIPEALVYVSGPEHTVSLAWEDIESVNTRKFRVRTTYVVEEGNAKTLETARTWVRFDQRKALETKRGNTPFRVTICALEVRERGGRAYKVVDEDGHYFDLREDVMLDAILNCNISSGKIEADFIWARLGSQMKLVRLGSELHDALIKATQRGAAEKVKVTELEPGGIYRNVKGERFIVIGLGSTIAYEYSAEQKAVPKQHTWDKDVPGKAATLAITKEPRMVVAVELSEYRKLDEAAAVLKSALNDGDTYSFKVQKSLTVVERVGRCQLPADIWEQVRGCAKDEAGQLVRKSGWSSLAAACYVSRVMNLSPEVGKPAVQAEFERSHEQLGEMGLLPQRP
jgi:hypothetical protein